MRSFMNWDELSANAARNGYKTKDVLAHWQKLGTFRRDHPAVGADTHQMLTPPPYYTFKREYNNGKGFTDQVVAGLDLPAGNKEVSVAGVFQNGTLLKDYYSGQQVTVQNDKVSIQSAFSIVLLGKN